MKLDLVCNSVSVREKANIKASLKLQSLKIAMDLISIFCGFCLFVGIVLTAVKLYEVSIKKPFVSEIKLHGKTAIVTGANTGTLIHLCLLCKFIHVCFFVHQNE